MIVQRSIKICDYYDIWDQPEHYLFDIRCKHIEQLWAQMDDKKYKKCVFGDIKS